MYEKGNDGTLNFIGCELMYYKTDMKALVDTVLRLTSREDGLFLHAHIFRTYVVHFIITVEYPRIITDHFQPRILTLSVCNYV